MGKVKSTASSGYVAVEKRGNPEIAIKGKNTQFKKGEKRTKDAASKGGKATQERTRIETNVALCLSGVSTALDIDIDITEFTEKEDNKIRDYVRSLSIPKLRELVAKANTDNALLGHIAYEAKKVLDEYDDERGYTNYQDDYRDRKFGKPAQTIRTPDLTPPHKEETGLEEGNEP